MEQSYANAYPQDTAGPSAPLTLHGGGVTGVIVDSRFCASYPVGMAFERKYMKLTADNFVITDVQGNMLFKVKDQAFGLHHDKRVLLDGYESPVLTFQEKTMSMHNRWKIFRGDSSEPEDLLYSVKNSSMVQLKMNLDVFLSHKKKKKTCDFRVKVNSTQTSFIVYAGESDVIVAQMEKNERMQNGKNINYCGTVYPNVDFAFIASLIVIILYPFGNRAYFAAAMPLVPLVAL